MFFLPDMMTSSYTYSYPDGPILLFKPKGDKFNLRSISDSPHADSVTIEYQSDSMYEMKHAGYETDHVYIVFESKLANSFFAKWPKLLYQFMTRAKCSLTLIFHAPQNHKQSPIEYWKNVVLQNLKASFTSVNTIRFINQNVTKQNQQAGFFQYNQNYFVPVNQFSQAGYGTQVMSPYEQLAASQGTVNSSQQIITS